MYLDCFKNCDKDYLRIVNNKCSNNDGKIKISGITIKNLGYLSNFKKSINEVYEMKITYVTGNWAKIMNAKEILEPLGIEVDNEKIETEEIQANSVEEIAMHSAKYASEKLKCDVLKNDSGLFVEILNGFPGPYTHYVDDTLGEDGLLKLLEGKENRNACFIEAFSYCEYGSEPVVFKSITKGTIAKEKSGVYGWSWDYIFIPDGYNKTMANYPDEERFKLWNTDAYYELADYLKSKKSKN